MELNDMLNNWEAVSLEEALAEVDRELGVRRKCFPRWVTEGRVASVDARDRLRRLTKAAAVLSAIGKTPAEELAAMMEASGVPGAALPF